jgi:hypothetical protein
VRALRTWLGFAGLAAVGLVWFAAIVRGWSCGDELDCGDEARGSFVFGMFVSILVVPPSALLIGWGRAGARSRLRPWLRALSLVGGWGAALMAVLCAAILNGERDPAFAVFALIWVAIAAPPVGGAPAQVPAGSLDSTTDVSI